MHYNNSTDLFLAAECAPTPTVFCNCKLNDVRVYATALSAEDIKQLYNLGAKVDNTNKYHSFEFVEESDGSVSSSDITTTSIALGTSNNSTTTSTTVTLFTYTNTSGSSTSKTAT